MTSFHTLPSLKDILNPLDGAAEASRSSKSTVQPGNKNHVSMTFPKSPLTETPEHRQLQLYHSHSVPGPHGLTGPSTTSPAGYPQHGSPATEAQLQHLAVKNSRPASFAADCGSRHQVSAILSQQTPPPGTSDRSMYAVSDRIYQPETLRPGLQIEPRAFDNGPFYGEERYWSFSDGSQGRKYGPGEFVNPQWGITKAGKPRKRLAQACTTCREKKIKCDPMIKSDPSSPKCAQCQKFGRECKFENGPRCSTHSSTLPSSQEHRSSNLVTTPEPAVANGNTDPGSTRHPEQENSVGSKGKLDPKNSGPPRSEKPSRPIKRTKSEVDSSSESEVKEQAERTWYGGGSPKWSMAGHKTGPTLWDFDPHEVDSESRTHYLDLYFLHVNCASYCMFPKEPFMDWVRTCNSKSSLERMLVFSLLAMGTIFSTREQHKRDGEEFAAIAKYGLDKNLGNFVLPLVQSRLILGLYYFAVGDAGKAWDLAGGGLRSASALKLNLESGVQDTGDSPHSYGLTKTGLIECRRRTFWSAYIMDRFNGFCSGHLSVVQNDDCLLRLPIKDQIYERQGDGETPFFENDNVDPALSCNADRSLLGAMGYHAQISSIWGEVLANIYRSSHRWDFDYAEKYEEFYNRLNCQLSRWMSRLPPELTNSQVNTDRSIREGYIGTYIGLHTLYHATLMKLNRHCRWKLLSPDAVERNIRKAHHHATEVLHIVQTLTRTDRKVRLPDVEFAFSTPFTSYSVLTAVDILSAGGFLEDLPQLCQLLDSGLEVVTELAGFWSIARRHKSSILSRIKDIGDSVQDPAGDKRVFATDRPMDTTFPKEEDIIYAVPRERMHKALGIDDVAIEDDAILRVKSSHEGGIAYI